MPVVDHASISVTEPFPQMHSKLLVHRDTGSRSMTVNEGIFEPGASMPMHIHPDHEEAVVILEGELEYVLGDDTFLVGAGSTVLIPSGVKHQATNKGAHPTKVIGIFPTLDVRREFL